MPSTDSVFDSWRKSTFSGYNTNCVEVGLSGDSIGVRDSKNPRGAIVPVTTAGWGTFLAGVRAGELDRQPGNSR